MSQDAVIKNLSQLGFSAVAVDTVERACKHVAWFPEAVVEAVKTGEADRNSDAAQAATKRIKALLKAASAATAALLERLGVDAGVAQVFACAQLHPFFSELAKYAKGDEAAGQRAAAMLTAAAHAQAGVINTGSCEEAAPAPSSSPAVPPQQDKASQDETLPSAPVQTEGQGAVVAPKRVRYVRAATAALAYSTEPLDGRQAVLALNVAAAARAGHYDWRNQIGVTLSASEAILVFAVLTGQLPSVEIASQGGAVKKLAIGDQAGAFVVQASQGKRVIAVPLGPLDALQFALRVSDVFVAAHPQLRDMEGLRRFATQFVAKLLPLAA